MINSEKFHALLLGVRPAELADFLKRLFCIKRRVAETPRGLKLWLDPVTHFAREATSGKGYEPEMSALVTGLLRPGDVFVDIGANEGYFSTLAATVVGDGRVFAVEPQGRLIPVIEENLKLNGASNATVSHLALADRNATATIHLQASVNTGVSGLFNPGRRGTGTETVPTMTLDDYFAANGIGRVRLMKVDCEGGEKLVLEGGRETLRSKRIEVLAWEYHPLVLSEEEIRTMDEFLQGCGYSFLNLGGQTLYCLPGLEEKVRAARDGRGGSLSA
jgi:FkbM family methyltransferase